MKYCSNCGKEISEGNTFCSSCGAPIAKSQESQQTASNVSEGSYSLPIVVSGIIGLILGIFGYLNFYCDVRGNAAEGMMKSFSQQSELQRQRYIAYLAYKSAAYKMNLLIIIGITLIVIGIIVWIVSGRINPRNNNILRALSWIIPLAIVLLTAAILFIPCLSYTINYS